MSEENYNKQSVELRRVVPSESNCTIQQPGDFCWDFDHERLGGKREDKLHFLYLCLPGETRWSPIQVQNGPTGGDRIWGWDGNEEKPTVTPSIHCVGHWHGHLNNGFLKSC